jgi:hypothetical protein
VARRQRPRRGGRHRGGAVALDAGWTLGGLPGSVCAVSHRADDARLLPGDRFRVRRLCRRSLACRRVCAYARARARARAHAHAHAHA